MIGEFLSDESEVTGVGIVGNGRARRETVSLNEFGSGKSQPVGVEVSGELPDAEVNTVVATALLSTTSF